VFDINNVNSNKHLGPGYDLGPVRREETKLQGQLAGRPLAPPAYATSPWSPRRHVAR